MLDEQGADTGPVLRPTGWYHAELQKKAGALPHSCVKCGQVDRADDSLEPRAVGGRPSRRLLLGNKLW
jgi:hypothetical protein